MPETTTPAVRRAGPDDVDAIVALGRAVVPATYGPIDADLAASQLERWWSTAAVADSVDRLPHWVADDPAHPDRLAGVANLGTADGTPTMWKIYVHPEHQGTGLGAALLAAVEDAVDGPVLQLEMVAGNDRAARFYARHGFVETGRTPLAGTPGVEQVWMSKELR